MTSPGKLWIGTSGYAYPKWKGTFYPAKFPDREMLKFYGQQFPTVELNNTFYRLPTEKNVAQWAESVPPGFQFAMKMNQRVTHILKLRNSEPLLKHFLQMVSLLDDGDHLGPILIQLPPTFRADLAVLEEFLAQRPRAFRFAFEVRHASWHAEETYALLRKHETAWCLAETDDAGTPEVITAPFTYLRLRRDSYTPKQLSAWRQRINGWLGQGLDVYAYLKHEDEGKAPAYARRLLDAK